MHAECQEPVKFSIAENFSSFIIWDCNEILHVLVLAQRNIAILARPYTIGIHCSNTDMLEAKVQVVC